MVGEVGVGGGGLEMYRVDGMMVVLACSASDDELA